MEHQQKHVVMHRSSLTGQGRNTGEHTRNQLPVATFLPQSFSQTLAPAETGADAVDVEEAASLS